VYGVLKGSYGCSRMTSSTAEDRSVARFDSFSALHTRIAGMLFSETFFSRRVLLCAL
jgi:hypothetical protein